MTAEVLTVVCAWCQRVVIAGPAGAVTTHTICPSCVDLMITRSGKGPSEPSARPSPDSLKDAIKH